MSTRWFTARRPRLWRRCVVEMHTKAGVGPDDRAHVVAAASVVVEVVGRYWSSRKARDLARVLNVMMMNGGQL